MSSEKTVEIVIRYDGNTADTGKLGLFEAVESLEGISRVVNLIVHAFVNKGEIRQRLKVPVGAETYLAPAKRGCFEECVEVNFGHEAIARIKPSVIVTNFWDYFACCISVTVGREYDPTTPMVRKISETSDAFFEEISEQLESPLQNLHRPIRSTGATTITFARPKSGDILTLDSETLDYVSVLEQEEQARHWIGNVTKYNSLSGYGRMYIDEYGKTIPFRIEDFANNVRTQRAAANSLNERVTSEDGKRKIVGYPVFNSMRTIKRIVVREINPIF